MKRFVPVAACAAAVLALTGCAQSPYSVEIAYEIEGKAQRTSFVPGDLTCLGSGSDGAVGFRFHGNPFYQISVSAGDPGQIEVGAFDDGTLLFLDSDEAVVTATRFDDGSVEYSVKADSNTVALVSIDEMKPDETPDMSGVPRYSGSIDAKIRCVPADAK